MGDALCALAAVAMIGVGVWLLSPAWALIVVGALVLVLTIYGRLSKGANRG